MNYLITRNRDFPSIFDELLFKDFFGENLFSPLPSLKKIDYPVDVYETDKGLEIDIAAIGLDKSDMKIDIDEDVVSVSHKKQTTEEKGYAYRGITQKSFSFAWRINDKFDVTKTEANLEKGLLKITIPFAPEKKPKKIEISIK